MASHRCTQPDCNGKFHLCSMCCVLATATAKQRLLCKKCWHANGDICAYCNVNKARRMTHFLRACRPCKDRCFCASCGVPHPDMPNSVTCVSCSQPALWCTSCCSEMELLSGVCRYHYDLNDCMYCYTTNGAASANRSLSWSPCSTTDCSKQVRACSRCRDHFPNGKLVCDACWKDAGQLCIICRSTEARHERKYLHCCQACFGKQSPEFLYEFVHEESQHYINSTSAQQCWTGAEPALQLLLGAPPDAEPLPQYSEQADFLSPSHCRVGHMLALPTSPHHDPETCHIHCNCHPMMIRWLHHNCSLH